MEFVEALDPATESKLVLRLYRNVENIQELRKKLLSNEISCCILKPSLIYDPLQVVVAANKALIAEKITTKSIYTEILFNLSISKNITQSLQKFGIGESDNDLIIVVIVKNGAPVDNEEDLYSIIKGKQCPVSELNEIRNLNEIKKAYKITDVESKNCLLDSIVTRIAVKDCL